MIKAKRGQQAEQPVHIPMRGWWDITKRIFKQMSDDNLSLVAAGVAFYALLAIFPAIAAIVSVYAYFSVIIYALIYNHISMITTPPATLSFLKSQALLKHLVQASA